MPGLDFFAPLVIFAFSGSVTPGPNNIIIATAAVNCGFRSSLPAAFGVCFGFTLMVLCVTLGVAGIFLHYPFVQVILRVVSSVFMLYLAWKIATADIAAEQSAVKPPSFRQMFVFQWINPKAWAISSVAAVAFTTGDNVIFAAVLLALVFLSISLPCLLLWGGFGAAMGDFLRATALRLRVFNCIMAILMLAAFILTAF